MGIETLAIVVALILSIVLHEMAHGYMANWLGDPTARLAGRLSANPLVHIDPLGSVIVPALLLLGPFNFIFGWAKPVPYNPYNLTDQKYGEAKVAVAGPGMNILIALIFSVLVRLAPTLGLNAVFVDLALAIVFLNLFLALLNLIPIPPLDGSKILLAFLPYGMAMKYREFMNMTERYGLVFTFIFFFVFISLLLQPFVFLVLLIYGLFTGASYVPSLF